MQTWKTISRKVIYKQDKFITVESHKIELPDGRVIVEWPWIITPDFVNVLGVTEKGKFLCFRQTKYGVDGTSLAPVGGYLEPDEEPIIAAQRELLEETGYEASKWIELGHYRVDANRGAGIGYLFLARSAHFVKKVVSDELEEQKLIFLNHSEIETALENGEFKVLSWATTIALALRYLEMKNK